MEKHYICIGTCGAVISQHQYNEGLKQCGAPEGCTMKGHEFVACKHCPTCDAHTVDLSAHKCQAS